MSVNGKRFLKGSVRIPRCGRSFANWVVRHPRSAAKFVAMAGRIAIGLHGPIRQHGIGPCPKLCKLACRPFLRRTVSAKLQRKWSPELIAGWLKRTYPGKPHNQVLHETPTA